MAHFAQLNENNIVTRVIVVSNDDILDDNLNESERIGIDFCKKLFGNNTKWIQTSYNNNFRGKYAGIGYQYNEKYDSFISPKPFESWILNEETLEWKSPLGNPPELTEEQKSKMSFYRWEEDSYLRNNETGWILEVPDNSENI